MSNHPIVSRSEWIQQRKKLLAREKEFTKLRDELSQEQRSLPWTRVESDYVFQGADGHETLSDLFDSRSQLIIYHFMFATEWTEGCKSCSFLADHYEPSIVHLRQRDVSMVTVSLAPWETLNAFQKRMGWSFKWVSSAGSSFNRDFHVSFTAQELERGNAYYNYQHASFPVTEAPGLSVFYKDEAGEIFHTYSTYARGLDAFIGAYHLLDVVPKGRDENKLAYSMEWIRHHDRYDDPNFVDPYVDLLGDDQLGDGDRATG